VYNDGLGNVSHTWLLSGNASDHYFRFDIDVQSGSFTGNATGTNLQMNTNYLFYVTADATCNGGGVTSTVQGTWSFRDSGDNVIVSKSFKMEAYAISDA